MTDRPAMVRDRDTIEIRLTKESEYRIPFTFIEALNEGTLFDRPAHVFQEAAREHRLFHVLNRNTENILGTGVIQLASNDRALQAKVGGLMVHPAARGFGIASLLLKVMMLWAVHKRGHDAVQRQFLAHVVYGNIGPVHALLEAGFRPAGEVEIHRGEIDATFDHMLKAGETTVRLHAFTFDREAIGSLALSLWKFCHERRGAISRGDVRIEVDFSAVIRPDQLDAQVERLKLR